VTKYLVLMMGAQGAGKSTWIKRQGFCAPVASADTLCIDDLGAYRWSVARAKVAHDRCRGLVASLLRDKVEPLIFVDNTNARLEYVQPYQQMAKVAGYKLGAVYLSVTLDVALRDQTHGAPAETVKRVHAESRLLAGYLAKDGVGVLTVARTANVYATAPFLLVEQGYGVLCHACRHGRSMFFDPSLPCTCQDRNPVDSWMLPDSVDEASRDFQQFLFSKRNVTR